MNGTNAAIEQLIPAREQDLGGFSVRRLIPYRGRRMVGPWIFFDHLGPVDFQSGRGIDVRPHPHINLATVTYLFDGVIRHRDSLGNDQLIEPGAINLMVAGSGIVHSEREPAEVRQTDRRLHGLQLWLALPDEVEEMPPAFEHYPAGDIPAADAGGVPVRVMMGAAFGVSSPVRTFAQTLYFEARLSAGQRLRVPVDIDECAVYVTAGMIAINGENVPPYTMAVLRPGATAELLADQDSSVAVIGVSGCRRVTSGGTSYRAGRTALSRQSVTGPGGVSRSCREMKRNSSHCRIPDEGDKIGLVRTDQRR